MIDLLLTIITITKQTIRMKKLFLLLIVSMLTNLCSAQTENYKIAFSEFKKNYNSGTYAAIFDSFSAEMKNALPIMETKEFLSILKSQAGNIKNATFVDYKEETYASFKTEFEKTVSLLNISLNEDNQINGLFLSPLTEKSSEAPKNVFNDLSQYPKAIGDIIFEKAKNFPNHTQLSIALIQDGQTRYYGIIKENDSIKSISNQNKVFEIGSITKTFTSTVLASLVSAKKINLTDNVNPYFSFPFHDDIQINFEDLANHTSGMSRLPENLDATDVSNPYKSYGKKEMETYLKDSLKLHSEPGKAYAYSNLGAGLLGYTMGLSQKTTIQKLIQKRVFDKYKMKNSFTSSKHLNNKLAQGRDPKGEIFTNWDFDVLFAGGGILSTVEDLSKYAIAQFNPKNKELALTRNATFTINKDMKIGLGWHILKSNQGNDLIWHNGGTGGYSSSMVVNVDHKTAVIILSNLSGFHPESSALDEISLELINKLEK